LQILPSQEDHNADFEHLSQLTATIKAQELFTLEAQDVLHRLYHQEEVSLFDPIEVSFKCTCSRERSAAAIKTIDQAEVEAILAEDGKVEMGCEYCNAKYVFDGIDIAAIYANGTGSNTQQ
ncbi:MAG: Hsp33 family molecular chaperone HslO, partial [Shewanella sp.]